MRIPLYIRIVLIIVAGISLVWLPWIITIFLLFIAGLAFPPAAVALGILADLLYYPGSGFLWGSVYGAVAAILATLVRHFVKTRIM